MLKPLMNPAEALDDAAQRASALAELYAPVQDEMSEVEEMLQRELRSEFQQVDEMLRHGVMLGGKRLRPALLLLSAKATTGDVSPDHITLAAVVEMIHTATLIHDDVLDEAQLRRHLATANARWDNEASVLLGDYLFTHAFYLASTLESTFGCRTIGRATNIVCEGELRQVRSRGNYALAEDEYYQIIEAKTAELCACACRLGAHYASADAASVEKLSQFGRHLGIAFQIADDLLDVVGDQLATGKSLGTDLEKQKATLPLIHLLRSVSPEQREQIVALLQQPSEDRRADLAPWLEQYDSVNFARRAARRHAQAALDSLRHLPPTAARQSLEVMAQFVVLRSH